MLLKMVLKFSMAQNGWQEVYWVDVSSATPESYLPTAEAFAKGRNGLLCASAVLQEISIVNPAVPRHTVVSTLVSKIKPGFNADTMDVADTAVMIRFLSFDRTRKRPLWLRGFPDEGMQFAGNRSLFPPAQRAALTVFLNACLNIGLVIHGKTPLGDARTLPPILDIRPTVLGTRIAIKSPNHLLKGGDIVTIRKAIFNRASVDPKQINGSHIVIPSIGAMGAADWFEINVPPGTLQIGDYAGKGVWTKRSEDTAAVKFAEAVRFATRSTGRSPVLTRGRRYAKRRVLPLF